MTGLYQLRVLIVGVAAASATRGDILVAGVAGLVAGAMSMAAGEYVSVSSQSDTERADLARERAELANAPEFELNELAEIYAQRGVEPALARQVAQQLMTKDALGAHARDELGISEFTTARPVQAAFTSAATFAAGAALAAPDRARVSRSHAHACGVCLVAGVPRRTRGPWRAIRRREHVARHVRVTFWGAFAMALTAGVGALFGAVA